MEDLFRSVTDSVLAHCEEDVDLFHKHVAPGHRVSPEGHSYAQRRVWLHYYLSLHMCVLLHLKDTVDDALKKSFPVWVWFGEMQHRYINQEEESQTFKVLCSLRITYTEAIDVLKRSSEHFTFPTDVSFFFLMFACCTQMSTLTSALLLLSGVVTWWQNTRSTWWNIAATFQCLSLITPTTWSLFMLETTRIVPSVQ